MIFCHKPNLSTTPLEIQTTAAADKLRKFPGLSMFSLARTFRFEAAPAIS
jgi:hypothetical protein